MALTQQNQQLWKIACGPNCGFLIRAHDKEEVLRAGINHDRLQHGGKASEAEMRRAIEPADVPVAALRR